MNGKLSSHDHGNCELCDFLESRLAQAQANEEALRKVIEDLGKEWDITDIHQEIRMSNLGWFIRLCREVVELGT